MTQSRPSPYIHVGWIRKLLVGDNSCEWASWFKAHNVGFAKMPSDFNMTKWKIAHTALVSKTRTELAGEGRIITSENQNYFTLPSRGIVLAGQPDLVVVENGRGTVYDMKTGQPNQSDVAQVMIYMYALPFAFPKYKGMEFDGVVVYSDHQVPIPHTAIDDDFKKSLSALINRIADSQEAIKIPSGLECGYCELTKADCEDRVDEQPLNDVSETTPTF